MKLIITPAPVVASGVKRWSRVAPPMVWHADYSIPWPSSHRFAMWKFDDLRLEAVRSGVVASEAEFFEPSTAGLEEALRLAHDEAYLRSFERDSMDEKLWRRIGFTQRPDHAALVRRTKLECAGTLLAARLALRHGLACNLAGGTHHAHRGWGAGYTVVNDLAVAALTHLRLGPDRRVLVVDLDVHQGDGTAEILRDEPRALTFSLHCADNFPFGFNPKYAPHLGKDASDVDVGLAGGAGDAQVMAALAAHLPGLLDRLKPTLVLFDAGVDAHQVDGLGKFQMTDRGLYDRDRFVIDACVRRDVPCATVIGGGYDSDRWRLARRHAVVLQAAKDAWRDSGLADRPAPRTAPEAGAGASLDDPAGE